MSTIPDRVEIFLDGSNFYNGLRGQFGSGFYSVARLVERIRRSRLLVSLNFYTATLDHGRQPEAAAAQRRFLETLATLPYPTHLFTRPLQYHPRWPVVPPVEKGIDAKIVEDLIVGAFDQRYDVAILLSGDRDFVEVLRLLRGRFRLSLETYYPMTRCHLYRAIPEAFTQAEVITKKFFKAISYHH